MGALRSSQERVTPAEPDHDYYTDVKDHLNGKLATISMARKLARRCFHVLRAVDPDEVYATP